jgi:hypothetical protein
MIHSIAKRTSLLAVIEPDELKTVTYKDGRPIGEAIVRTAGEPARLRLAPTGEIQATAGITTESPRPWRGAGFQLLPQATL